MVKPFRILTSLGASESVVEAIAIGAVTALAYLALSRIISGELRGMKVEEIARALGARRFNITWSR